MTGSIIKHSSQFLLEARQLKRFLNPIVSQLISQAEALEYSIWRTSNHQNKYPAENWDTMEALATERGWRVTRVHHGDKLEFILFSPADANNLAISRKLGTLEGLWEDLTFTVDEQERLSEALLAQGFTLKDLNVKMLIYTNTSQGASLPQKRNERVLFENPFPEAHTFMRIESTRRTQLKYFAKLIEEQGEEYGYVVEIYNSKGNDQLALVEPTLRKAAWLVTKVLKGEDLDFVLLTPVAQPQLDIRTRYYGQHSLDEDDQNRLIKALAQNSYQLTERDAHYLSFTLTRAINI